MVDIVSRAGEFESVSTEEPTSYDGFFDLVDSQATAAGYREVDTVINESCMDFVGHGLDKIAQEFDGNLSGRFFMQLDKDEFRRSIDGHKEMELAADAPTTCNTIAFMTQFIRFWDCFVFFWNLRTRGSPFRTISYNLSYVLS